MCSCHHPDPMLPARPGYTVKPPILGTVGLSDSGRDQPVSRDTREQKNRTDRRTRTVGILPLSDPRKPAANSVVVLPSSSPWLTKALPQPPRHLTTATTTAHPVVVCRLISLLLLFPIPIRHPAFHAPTRIPILPPPSSLLLRSSLPASLFLPLAMGRQ